MEQRHLQVKLFFVLQVAVGRMYETQKTVVE